MASNVTQLWGTHSQAYSLDWTPSSSGLAHDSAIVGEALTLSGKTPIRDVLVSVQCKGTSTLGSDYAVHWFAAGSVDNGSTYTGGVAANDSEYATFSNNTDKYPHLRFGPSIPVKDTSAIQKGGPFSLAALFGGVLPEKVILGVWNRTNQPLTNSDTDNKITYQVVYDSVG
jgi:hypothetical protein